VFTTRRGQSMIRALTRCSVRVRALVTSSGALKWSCSVQYLDVHSGSNEAVNPSEVTRQRRGRGLCRPRRSRLLARS
jgi:hypothetical protein